MNIEKFRFQSPKGTLGSVNGPMRISEGRIQRPSLESCQRIPLHGE